MAAKEIVVIILGISLSLILVVGAGTLLYILVDMIQEDRERRRNRKW